MFAKQEEFSLFLYLPELLRVTGTDVWPENKNSENVTSCYPHHTEMLSAQSGTG